MALEIERKFLVGDNNWRNQSGRFYRQGYITNQQQVTVRVRVADEKGFLTIKGESVGPVRPEYEYEIPLLDAHEMLDKLCQKPLIEKKRYTITHKGFVWEVDEFLAENEGLIIAEIELADENQAFEKPDWIGQEVTGDPRYYNANLAQNPYKLWRNK